MTIEFSNTALRYLRKTKIRNPKAYRKITKTLTQLKDNPNHPSLRLHKLTGIYKARWSVSIDKGLRMVFIFKSHSIILITDIGTHDQVYR